MAVLLDTGVVYAYYDRTDTWHEKSLAVFDADRDGLIVPAPVIPEVDHLIGKRLGERARAVLYDGLAAGHFFVADLPLAGYRRVVEINDQFASLKLGFVDAAVIAIGESLGLNRVATTDLRDFGPVAAELGIELIQS